MAASVSMALRGRVLAPDPHARKLIDWPDALIRITAAGTITTIEPTPADCTIPQSWPGAVILPGFVDTHLHFPQLRILGSATGPLLEWLTTTVFPEEARFRDNGYAESIADTICQRMASFGTTTAAIYSSAHPGATEALFGALERSGLRAYAGLTLMDRNAPPAVTLDAATALTELAALVDRWHARDDGRLHVSVIPRFALSCSPNLLAAAASFARRHALLVQTHLSENLEEVRQTAAAFPESQDYLGVYEDHGYTDARTLLAHCIHLSDQEWARVRDRDMAVAHCPDSNFFLGSGCMPLRRAIDAGIRVGLGSDVGAGRTFSMPRVAAAAYDAAQVRGEPVSPTELLWLATRGGSLALSQEDRVGCIAPGFDADLVAVDVPRGTTHEVTDALLFRHDAGRVRATFVRGRQVHGERPQRG
ncbi:MAG: guanine deaminase [Myxococcales bacterium FL481]|nr:MAG: guanine deaminase [Myxococcales bacterium FL481]